MSRWIRIAVLCAMVASVLTWVGGASPVAAQNQVYTDSMDSSAGGLLSSESPDATRFKYGYQNSQFIMQALENAYDGEVYAFIGVPNMASSRVEVDTSIAGDTFGKYAFVGCRASTEDEGYMLEIHPNNGNVIIWRMDPDTVVELARVDGSAAVNIGGANNHIAIDCDQNIITGYVNGQQVLSATDSTFASGQPYIGTGSQGSGTDGLLTGFDNLTVTNRDAQPLPTTAPLQPTAAAPLPTEAAPLPTTAAPLPTAVPVQPTASGEVAGPLVPITEPSVDPDGTLNDAFLFSLSEDPVAGPLQGDADLDASDFKNLPANVQLQDFYAELTYLTPPVTPAGVWAFGFGFWSVDASTFYDMFIQSDGTTAKWSLGQSTAAGYSILQSGDLPVDSIDFTPGAENYVSLAVYHGYAVLSGTSFELGASVQLPTAPVSGDVFAEAGFLATDQATTQTLPVSISDFMVWDLSSGMVEDIFADITPEAPSEPTSAAGFPTAIPAVPQETPTVQQPVAPTEQPLAPTQAPVELSPTVASSTQGQSNVLDLIFASQRDAAMASAPLFTSPPGTLTQSADGFKVVSSGASVTDFYATATFVNPTDLSTRSDIGIGFRDALDNQEYRFVVRTDGEWALATGSGSPLAQGTVTNFDATPGATNTIEVVAVGATGLVAVNGVVVQQLDLSAHLNAGDVYIASGMYDSDTVEGRQVQFQEFAVYPISA